MKIKLALFVMIVGIGPAAAQVRTPPPIPNETASEESKVAACKESINEMLGWQLGDSKRLREWCRDNGYITYQQQLEAEKMTK